MGKYLFPNDRSDSPLHTNQSKCNTLGLHLRKDDLSRASEGIFSTCLSFSEMQRLVKPASRLTYSTKHLDPTKQRTGFETYVSHHQHAPETPLSTEHPVESPFLSGSCKSQSSSSNLRDGFDPEESINLYSLLSYTQTGIIQSLTATMTFSCLWTYS